MKPLTNYLNLNSLVCIASVFLPNKIKIFVLNLLPGNNISQNCYIGLSIIKCRQLIMKNGSKIGHFNYIGNIDLVILEEEASILNMNRIKNFSEMQIGEKAEIWSKNYVSGVPSKSLGNSKFILENNVLITAHHYFDLIGSIIIKEHVTVAGNQTFFYTHAFDLNGDRIERNITIGKNSYIGSGCIVLADIAANVIIGAGTTVYKDILHEGLWSSHKLARIGEAIPISKRLNQIKYEKNKITFRIRKNNPF